MTAPAVPTFARDPFPRRTATLTRLAPWILEVGRTLPGLVESYRPGGALAARERERIILAVTEVNGCRYCAWIHGSWRDWLGDADPVAAEDAVLAYARASAEAGEPVEPAALAQHLPAAAVAAVRATVAQIEVSNLVGNTVDGFLARLTRKRPADPVAAAGELAVIAAAVPVAIPMLSWAAAMKIMDRLAPPIPVVDMPPKGEANLLAHLVASVAPRFLANAAVRLAVLGSPAVFIIGIRAGRTAVTVRIGRSHVAVDNGIAPDVHFVVEGEVEPLLRLATGALLEGIAGVRIERH
jgi:alkylhydroperoxidase family enzyme